MCRMCLHSKLIFVYVGFGVGAREEKRGSEVTNSSIMRLHVMVQWTISWTGSVIGFCFVLFCFFPWACKTSAVISSGGPPTSLSKPHQLHTHLHTLCGTRRDFMSKAHQLPVAYLMWTGCSQWFEFKISCTLTPCFDSTTLGSFHCLFTVYFSSFFDIYCMSANDLPLWLSNNWLILCSVDYLWIH